MEIRPVRVLLIYLVIVLLGGALLAPWLYFATGWAGEHIGALHGLTQKPFHRFVHRTMLTLAVAGLWPLCRSLGIRSWKDLGVVAGAQGYVKPLTKGFLVGFISLATIAGFVLMMGVRKWNAQIAPSDILKNFLTITFTALLVTTVEEILFRGALFGGWRRAHPWKQALIVSSAIYALVHFFSRPASPAIVTWTSGLSTLGEMLKGFSNTSALIPGFFNLWLVGIILTLAYQFTGTLYYSIGLHTGWIFWLKFYGVLTQAVPRQKTVFWGTEKLMDGWAAFVVLVATLIFVTWRLRGASPKGADGG